MTSQITFDDVNYADDEIEGNNINNIYCRIMGINEETQIRYKIAKYIMMLESIIGTSYNYHQRMEIVN